MTSPICLQMLDELLFPLFTQFQPQDVYIRESTFATLTY